MAKLMKREIHGLRKTPEYTIWAAMHQRCKNPNHKDFHYYGARGIKVCDRWSSFVTFLSDMGQRPSKVFSIDRIDNDRNYEPDNCRWVRMKDQCINRRTTRLLEVDGQMMSLTDAAKTRGITYTTLVGRLNAGWPFDKALSTIDHRKKWLGRWKHKSSSDRTPPR